MKMQRTAPAPAMTTLPEELVIEILSRLPGKEVARCKCVCKPLQSTIRSPPFQEAYRSRQRGLVMYLCESVEKEKRDGSSADMPPPEELSFYYSPLRHLDEPPPEKFSLIKKLGFDSYYDGVTQVVNGLVCHGESDAGFASDMDLTIYNVFTGEKMKVPEPMHISGKFMESASNYHLGYDPMTGTYKILRLVFQCKGRMGDVAANLPVKSFMIILRPSYSSSRWCSMNYNDCGLADLPLSAKRMFEIVARHEARTFPGDGMICWFQREEGLIMFDFNEEKFRYVKLPDGLKHDTQVFVRAPFNGLWVLALYVLPQDGQPECFVLEDKEGKKWRKEYMNFPEDMCGWMGSLAVADGDERVLLMNGAVGNQENSSRLVYSYSDDKSVEKFVVGKLPNKPLDLDGKCPSWDHFTNFNARLSCLYDGNVLYQPLNDVLSGADNLEPECDCLCYCREEGICDCVCDCGEESEHESEDDDSENESEGDDSENESEDESGDDDSENESGDDDSEDESGDDDSEDESEDESGDDDSENESEDESRNDDSENESED